MSSCNFCFFLTQLFPLSARQDVNREQNTNKEDVFRWKYLMYMPFSFPPGQKKSMRHINITTFSLSSKKKTLTLTGLHCRLLQTLSYAASTQNQWFWIKNIWQQYCFLFIKQNLTYDACQFYNILVSCQPHRVSLGSQFISCSLVCSCPGLFVVHECSAALSCIVKFRYHTWRVCLCHGVWNTK